MVILGDRMERSPATFRNLAPGKYPLRVMLPDYDRNRNGCVGRTGADVAAARLEVGAQQRLRSAFLGASRRGV